MSKFEILCATMHQTDFSKTEEMNIRSNVIFANQADETSYREQEFDGYTAKMITTNTRGVGKNRNFALAYASAKYCLFADDDVCYIDNLEETVVSEFEAHPDADVFIFHLDTDSNDRKQVKYPKTRKCKKIEKKPWGACRIAIKLDSVKKTNVWFTTLFGGGCIFPSGEDSMWIADAWKRGLCFYVSDKTIGKVSFNESTWFSGYDEKFFYGKGVFYEALHPKTAFFWRLYFAFRARSMGALCFREKMKWMKNGVDGYRKMLSYADYIESQK